MANLAARLERALRAAGVAITGVSVGNEADRLTWRVQPASAQAAAQPTITAFDPNDPTHEDAELDAAIKALVDTDRLTSSVVWAMIEALAPPATVAKYQAARAKIISAYKAQPWKP